MREDRIDGNKKIYILVTGFTGNKGGVENVIIRYYRAMKAIVHCLVFDLITYDKNPAYKEELTESEGMVVTIPSPRHVDYKRKLDYFFRKNATKYHAIWCNKCDLANIDYLKYAAKYEIPKRIIHSHNFANMYTGLHRKMVGILHENHKAKLLQYATDFWACSDYAASWMFPNEILNSDKVKFIPNAIDVSLYRFDYSKRIKKRRELGIENRFVIGFVGRITYQKNPEFALDVFNCFKRKVENAVFLVAGVGDLETEVKEKADTMHCKDAVHFLGARDDVPELMQAMDVLLLPSRFEGLPVVAVEAQAAGLPVFAASEGISGQTKITDLMHFIPLKCKANDWSDEIQREMNLCSNKKRSVYADIVMKTQFNIKRASAELLNILTISRFE